MIKRVFLIVVLVFGLRFCAAAESTFELRDGDRVAFIGGVFMEREQEEGFIETMLTLSFRDRDITFRNLGWSGDTVETHLHPKVPARPPYVPKLFDYIDRLKPTVFFVSYGMMESFRGQEGLPDFTKNYHELLDRLSQTTSRIILVSPFRHEALGGHWPDPARHNRDLSVYVDAIERIARERRYVFVNLFKSLPALTAHEERLTVNGVHLNTLGYQRAALAMQKELGLSGFVGFPRKEFELGEQIRPAIKHKNLQWWHHYRPMNSEYVYPGGTRYQDELGGVKHPMFEEIALFAHLADVEEAGVHLLKKRVLSGKGVGKTVQVSNRAPPTETPPDPELERRTFEVAEGFDVSLFAADPLISKPVQIAFDSRGRLWVATTTLYPQIKPGEDPSDKIIILEDKNQDGRADKTTVFADGLYIPTGILPVRDGVYVSDDTKIYFLRDRNDDGKADEKEVILSGFGTEDSHHKAHVFRWDPHGRFHFNVGVFLHNNIETAHGISSLTGHWQAGVFAYRPETGELDVHLANSIPPNPWGHYWNRWGLDFLIDSSGQFGSNFILPTANRTSSAIPVPGGNGKLSGGEILSGRHFPPEWQGNLVAAPFKENRLARWEFSDDSSGYAAKAMPPLIVSTDKAFRPVDHRVGPDGALYIADWYNPLIGHMQHHFRDPGRDFTHGRIWRVTAKGRPLVKPPKIETASIRQLLDHLKAPEDLTRWLARRELTRRKPEQVALAARRWIKNLDSGDSDFDHHRLEALWVLENIHVVEAGILKSLLQAANPDARAAAVVLLRHWRNKIPDALDLLDMLVVDEHPRVRLQAVIALSYFPERRAMEIAARALEKPMDNYLDQALKNTAVALKPSWEPALAGGETLFGGNSRKLDFVLDSAGARANPKALVAMLRLKRISSDNFEKTILNIAQNGERGDVLALFKMDFEGAQQAKVLSALAKAARERNIAATINTESGKRLDGWLASSDPAIKAEAIRLIGAWKGELFRARIIEIASDTQAVDAMRLAAVDALGAIGAGEKKDAVGGSESRLALRKLTRIGSPRSIRNAAIIALAGIDLVNAADRVAALMESAPVGEEISMLLENILQREHGADHLGQIIRTSNLKLHPDSAKVGLRFLQLTGRTDGSSNKHLIQLFNEAAGRDVERKELSPAELAELIADVSAKGDPVRGEQVFRRPDLMCFQCHAVGGAGGILGPELGAVGSGSQVDYLIESLLSPNKIIKDGFETWEVTSNDGESTLGVKVRENPQEVVLKDAVRNEVVFPRTQIKEVTHKTTSLMPAGLTDALTRTELVDLVRFLSELGKPGPYANNPNPIVRRWQTVAIAPSALAQAVSSAGAEALSWMPVYSLVSGILPSSEWSQQIKPGQSMPLIRFSFEVTTPGKMRLRVNAPEGLRFWVDGKALALKPETILDLPRGIHHGLFVLDPEKRRDGLLVELEQLADSPGRFQLVPGK